MFFTSIFHGSHRRSNSSHVYKNMNDSQVDECRIFYPVRYTLIRISVTNEITFRCAQISLRVCRYVLYTFLGTRMYVKEKHIICYGNL